MTLLPFTGVPSVVPDPRAPHPLGFLQLPTGPGTRVGLNVVDVSPTCPSHFLLGGEVPQVTVHDLRATPLQPLTTFCPSHLVDSESVTVTGAAWSTDGRRIVATYNIEGVCGVCVRACGRVGQGRRCLHLGWGVERHVRGVLLAEGVAGVGGGGGEGGVRLGLWRRVQCVVPW